MIFTKYPKALIMLLITCFFYNQAIAQQMPAANLKIVFIRHGEKPPVGNNLTCAGFNRSLKLVKVLGQKFGVPAYLFVPALGLGDTTKHSRMFETIVPFAVKHNLYINSAYAEKDSTKLAADLKGKKGTIIITWEHKAIAPIVRSLGVNAPGLKWPDDDFDSIWIVTFKNGVATLTIDHENIKPADGCSF